MNYETGDIGAHLQVIYSITRGVRPGLILDIGIRGGASTRAFDEGMHDGGICGDHHCCDINPKCERVVKSLKSHSIFHPICSLELAKTWAKAIDILFLDGCHQYEHVRDEINAYWGHIRPGGYILLHDTYPPEEKKGDVDSSWTAYQVLDDLDRMARAGALEFVTLEYCNGLTIARKK